MVRSSFRKRGRVTSANANIRRFSARRLLPLSLSPLFTHNLLDSSPSKEYLGLYEDRRQWHPVGSSAPARSFDRSRHRLTVVDRPIRHKVRSFRGFNAPRALSSQTKAALAFSGPSRVLVCVRRQIRREVMHARGLAGQIGFRRPRRTWLSEISCRG